VSVKAEKTAQCVDQLGSGNNKSHTYHVSKKARESLPIALGGKKTRDMGGGACDIGRYAIKNL